MTGTTRRKLSKQNSSQTNKYLSRHSNTKRKYEMLKEHTLKIDVLRKMWKSYSTIHCAARKYRASHKLRGIDVISGKYDRKKRKLNFLKHDNDNIDLWCVCSVNWVKWGKWVKCITFAQKLRGWKKKAGVNYEINKLSRAEVLSGNALKLNFHGKSWRESDSIDE